MTVARLALAGCCMLALAAGCLGGGSTAADTPTVTAAPVPSPEPTPEPAVTPNPKAVEQVRALHARTTVTPTEANA